MAARRIQFPQQVDDNKPDDSQEKKPRYKSSDELEESSVFLKELKKNNGKFPSNKERLEALIVTLEKSIGVMEGLFYYRPTQGSAYAITNLTAQLQAICSQLDQSYSMKDAAHAVVTDVLDPAIEGILISMGTAIRNELKDSGYEGKKREFAKTIMSKMLKQFGSIAQERKQEIETQVYNTLSNQ